jgi:hypothetical protein
MLLELELLCPFNPPWIPCEWWRRGNDGLPAFGLHLCTAPELSQHRDALRSYKQERLEMHLQAAIE